MKNSTVVQRPWGGRKYVFVQKGIEECNKDASGVGLFCRWGALQNELIKSLGWQIKRGRGTQCNDLKDNRRGPLKEEDKCKGILVAEDFPDQEVTKVEWAKSSKHAML